MSRLAIDRRLFIVGVPRSGTTLVQSLLAAHSEVTSFTESHFFSRHFKALFTQRPEGSTAILTRDPAPRLRDFLAENGWREDDENSSGTSAVDRGLEGLPPRLLLPFRTRPVARHLLRTLDELALLRGKSTWVEKTPRHLRYIPFLEKLLDGEPGTHFVHVIRGGLETVASLHAASQNWERPYDLEACVERWNADVAFSLSRARMQGDKRTADASGPDHFIVYEQLTAQPSVTLERLLADLGLAWEPEIFDQHRQGSERLITREETWKANVEREVSRSGTSKQVLTEAQRAHANASLRHDLYRELLERSS